MTEAKLTKYRVVTAENAELFEMRVNALADLGYTLKTVNIDSDHEARMFLYAVMTLGEENYENVVALKDVAPELVTDAINAGWSVCSTSLSTKFVRMVRRKKI